MFLSASVKGKEVALDLPGWTGKKITATSAGDIVIKDKPGLVGRLVALTDGVNVTIKDNDTAVWETITKVEVDFSSVPLVCGEKIVLNFSAAGEAWILYR